MQVCRFLARRRGQNRTVDSSTLHSPPRPAPPAAPARVEGLEPRTLGTRGGPSVAAAPVSAEGAAPLPAPLPPAASPAGEIPWDTRPAAGATPLDSTRVGAAGSYSWDVTAAVNDAVAAGRGSVT